MRLMVLLLAALVAGLSAGAATGALPNRLVIKFTSITAQKKGTTSCPAGVVLVQGRSRAGGAARARLCLLDQKKIATNTKAITSKATIRVAGFSGRLEALVRIVEVSKGGVSHRTITGIIYPGAGAFAHAGGRVFGTGTISFPKQGAPKVNLTFGFAFD
jgi:hypothetical protein